MCILCTFHYTKLPIFYYITAHYSLHCIAHFFRNIVAYFTIYKYALYIYCSEIIISARIIYFHSRISVTHYDSEIWTLVSDVDVDFRRTKLKLKILVCCHSRFWTRESDSDANRLLNMQFCTEESRAYFKLITFRFLNLIVILINLLIQYMMIRE